MNKSLHTEYLWCSTITIQDFIPMTWISKSEIPNHTYVGKGNFFCPSL